MTVNKVCNSGEGLTRNFLTQNEMTPRNDMETTAPQTHDTFEGTSAGETTSTRLAPSGQRSRRYTRIAVSLPIVLRDQFGGREETRTQFVMIRGAVVATTSNVRVGHKLTIQIAKTGRAAECHVVGLLKDVHSVEVEFTREQQDFWPVQFPPEDLKTDSGSYRFSTAIASSTLGSRSSSTTDMPKRETGEPSGIGPGSREIVSLADSIAGDSFTDTAFPKTDTAFPKPEKFTPRSTPVDSVAQFRAANRAAHRREQRTKVLYSALSIAGLAAAFMGGRYLIENRSEISQVSLPQVSLPSIKQVLPKAKPTEKPPAASSIDHPSSAVVTPPRPAPGLTDTPHAVPSSPSPEAEVTPPIVFEIKSADTQVAVRHGVPLASSRKAPEDVGEEPLALPLKVDDSNSATSKPEVLNQVVTQTPMKAALLAPQPVSRAVPAKLVYSTPAQYPAMARQIRAEGEVVISLDVDASGKVSAARAVSGPPILRAAALDAVKRWRYQPATLGDKPVVSTEVVKVQFKLR